MASTFKVVTLSSFIFAEKNRRRLHPMEDVCKLGAEGRSYAIADGVTLDCYTNDEFESSGAAKVAAIFCDAALESINVHSCEKSGLERGFSLANRRIQELNKAYRRGTGQGDNDYFGTVGAAAYICDNAHLHFGYVGDCRVIVIGAANSRKLETPDEVVPAREYSSYLYSIGITSRQERSKLVRLHARNRDRFEDEAGQHSGYGVFTGEPGVSDFFRFGCVSLDSNDLILMLTDGVVPLLEEERFTSLVNRYPQTCPEERLTRELASLCKDLAARDPAKYGDDKTMILVRFGR